MGEAERAGWAEKMGKAENPERLPEGGESRGGSFSHSFMRSAVAAARAGGAERGGPTGSVPKKNPPRGNGAGR